MSEAWQIVLVVAGAGVILEQVWEKVLVRAYRFFKFGERHVRADKVLMEIADYFKPNGGASLPETVQRIDRRLDTNCDDIAALTDKVDVFILGVQRGGQRATDPE